MAAFTRRWLRIAREAFAAISARRLSRWRFNARRDMAGARAAGRDGHGSRLSLRRSASSTYRAVNFHGLEAGRYYWHDAFLRAPPLKVCRGGVAILMLFPAHGLSGHESRRENSQLAKKSQVDIWLQD